MIETERLKTLGKILFQKLGGVSKQDGRIIRRLLTRIEELENQIKAFQKSVKVVENDK